MNKEITNTNDKGQLHGYQEWYCSDSGELELKCFFNNNTLIDYEEYYYDDDGLIKYFYI